MKNSRKVIVILLLVLLLIAAITVAACTPDDPHKGNDPNGGQGGGGNQGGGDKPTHQHTFAQEWSISDAEHWHAATCGHDVTADNAAHTLVNNVCSVCGYQNDVNWDDFTFEQSDDGYILTKYNGTAAHVNIPDTYNDLPVVGTGVDAFWECRESLVSITIPNSVTIIGESAFGNCYNLATVNFGANSKIESIGDEIFRGCSSLISITIPDSVTSIDEGAFFGCSSLTSIDIPDSVKTIGEGAFAACENLTTVKFGDNSKLESIEEAAFRWCLSLTQIFIHDGVTNISYAPFWGCYSLIIYCESSEQPSGWDSNWNIDINGYYCPVIWNCKQNNVADDGYVYDIVDGIHYGLKDSQAKVHGNNYSGDVTIPSNVQYKGKDYIVTSIDCGSFFYCRNLISIIIPDSITHIDDGAFSYCENLATVNISANSKLESIGDYAFEYCGSLISITIPGSVTSIGSFTFSGCSSLATVNFGANSKLESIGRSAFENCNSLKSITIPDNVTSIGDYAFRFCGWLTSVIIPDSVTSIGDYAFDNCTRLATVNFGANSKLESIGRAAFEYCDNLTSIFIPKSVTNMGSRVFYCCSNITIYCEAAEQPSGWDSTWNYLDCGGNSRHPVVWGATRQDAEQH